MATTTRPTGAGPSVDLTPGRTGPQVAAPSVPAQTMAPPRTTAAPSKGGTPTTSRTTATARGPRWVDVLIGIIVGAAVVGAGVWFWQLTHPPDQVRLSRTVVGTITKTPAQNRGRVCVAPPTPQLGGPVADICGPAYRGILGPDLASLTVGQKVRATTFQSPSPRYGSVEGVIIYLPTDHDWEGAILPSAGEMAAFN